MSNQFIFEFETSMIAANVNAHGQFKHEVERACENPATLSRDGVFYPRRNCMLELFMLKQMRLLLEQAFLVL